MRVPSFLFFSYERFLMLPKVHRAVTSYLENAATPVSRKICEDLKEGRLGDLVKTKVVPSHYSNAFTYMIDAQAVAFFSKNASLPTGIDLEGAALTAWWEAERRCCQTNARLARLIEGPYRDPVDLRLAEFLRNVKKRVTRWLGPVPNALYGRFGPGVTLCCRGSLSTVPDKMSITPTTTASLLPYLKWWEETAWAAALRKRGQLYDEGGCLKVDVRRSSLWTSVPKDAKTNRSIEIGPSLNVFHQLYIGKTMKSRFRARGWDLSQSADLHKRVACEASISGLFATIDLKQASDSVSKVLVKLCTPSMWFDLMDDLRTKSVMLPDRRIVQLEKFSGMGNGFTFELESVIFMAICQEVLTGLGMPSLANTDVFVFGDDLIVPTAAAKCVVQALQVLGFVINEDKTFLDGPFRESCGGDFFEGTAVRPHFLRSDPTTPEHLIAFANGLRRVSKAGARSDLEELRKSWFIVQDDLPIHIRSCRGPAELGDIVIHDDPQYWNTRWRSSIRYLRVWRPVHLPQKGVRQGGSHVMWSEFSPEVQLATRLLSIGDDYGVTPRGAVDGFKLGWVPRS